MLEDELIPPNKGDCLDSLFPELNLHSVQGSMILYSRFSKVQGATFEWDSIHVLFGGDKQRAVEAATCYGACAPRLLCTPGVKFSKREHRATRVPKDVKLYYYSTDPLFKAVAVDKALPSTCICHGSAEAPERHMCAVRGYYHCSRDRWWSGPTLYDPRRKCIARPQPCQNCNAEVFPWQFTPTLDAPSMDAGRYTLLI